MTLSRRWSQPAGASAACDHRNKPVQRRNPNSATKTTPGGTPSTAMAYCSWPTVRPGPCLPLRSPTPAPLRPRLKTLRELQQERKSQPPQEPHTIKAVGRPQEELDMRARSRQTCPLSQNYQTNPQAPRWASGPTPKYQTNPPSRQTEVVAEAFVPVFGSDEPPAKSPISMSTNLRPPIPSPKDCKLTIYVMISASRGNISLQVSSNTNSAETYLFPACFITAHPAVAVQRGSVRSGGLPIPGAYGRSG